MKSPEGAFYSAEDADSEGEEGKYYLWSQAEILSVLDELEAKVFLNHFDIPAEGDLLEKASDDASGKNILHVRRAIDKTAADFDLTADEASAILEGARRKILVARSSRTRPQRDDKILADWNGLAVAAMAIAGRVLGDDAYTRMAQQAMSFVLTNMRDSNGRLLHRYRDGEAAIPAFLDDYAFLVWGLIELYETTFDSVYLRTARDLNEFLREHFWNPRRGGFFFSSHIWEQLPLRQRDAYDGALPSGNSVSALNMIRLARLLGDQEQEDKASMILDSFADDISQNYAGHTMMLVGLDYLVGPSYEVIIAGAPEAESTLRMIHDLREHFMPNAVVIVRGDSENARRVDQIAPYTRFYNPMNNQTTGYVCINHRCLPPTTDPVQMLGLLGINAQRGTD
jgi:uncharacterized protein YyaL (SSP411 family)